MSSMDWLNENAGAVQTISTGVLILVTGAYVLLTGRLAREASRSARASEESAKGTRRAAVAMERSVQVAEAQLGLGFNVTFEEVEENTPSQWVSVAAVGARAFIHGLEVLGAYHDPEGKIRLVNGALQALDPYDGDLPVQLQGDRRAVFQWPGRRVDTSATNAAVASIYYSLTRDDEPELFERSITFPASPKLESTD